ncbi:hypothetical protein AOQ71_04850 [Bradyrhizobium manausense]|uniref:Transposase InsH N-terminal domain-containing protein n=1 Tax=Bradyrhizobium manausense TaxID=989370 RepID=A0A0R3E306_9BRAD|nr:hypothetical protein AOQ71_04850 [Bradyrhizobium manausense]
MILWRIGGRTMRPKKHKPTGSNDLFRARLDQIINMKHELVQLAGKVDWDWIDGEIAPLYSENGRPGIATRFVIGLLLLKHIYGLSDEGVCERWVHDPYFQFFTGEYVAIRGFDNVALFHKNRSVAKKVPVAAQPCTASDADCKT